MSKLTAFLRRKTEIDCLTPVHLWVVDMIDRDELDSISNKTRSKDVTWGDIEGAVKDVGIELPKTTFDMKHPLVLVLIRVDGEYFTIEAHTTTSFKFSLFNQFPTRQGFEKYNWLSIAISKIKQSIEHENELVAKLETARDRLKPQMPNPPSEPE